MDDNSNTKATIPPVPPVRLVDEQITDQNKALSLLVSFITLAQKRGSFTLEESSKIWECIKMFS